MPTVNNGLKCREPLSEVFDVHSNGVLPLRGKGVVFRYQEENRTDQKAKTTKGQGLKIEGDAPSMVTYESAKASTDGYLTMWVIFHGENTLSFDLWDAVDGQWYETFGRLDYATTAIV